MATPSPIARAFDDASATLPPPPTPRTPAVGGVAGLDRTSFGHTDSPPSVATHIASVVTDGVELVTGVASEIVATVATTAAPIITSVKPLLEQVTAENLGSVTASEVPPESCPVPPITTPPNLCNATMLLGGESELAYAHASEWTAADLVMLVVGPVAGTILLAIFGLAWNFAAEMFLYKGYGG